MGIKKRLSGAVLAAGIGVAAISGGTFALFSAEATNSGNTFTAGTLTIADVTGGAVYSTSTNIGNLAPGDKDDTKKLTIKNTGNLDAWVKIDSITKTGELFGGTHPVSVTYHDGAVLIPHGEERTFDVKYEFSIDAGNEYQGDTGSVKFNVKAVQSRNNTNSAGNGPTSW